MRYTKSSILSIALAVALNGSATAQNSNNEFPWRAKAKSAVTATAARATAATTSTVNSSLNAVQNRVVSKLAPAATAVRDLQPVASNAVAASSIQSMPDVIFDEGKKYIRQGDTYIESTMLGNLSNAVPNIVNGNYPAQLPQPAKKSLFQKIKGVGGRLNPFNMQIRSESAYEADNWKVPSFSDSISGLNRKDSDPITFAPINPLPAKVAQPSTIDKAESIYASDETYRPKKSIASRTSQFTSALPTGTSITSAVPNFKATPKVADLRSLASDTIATKSASIAQATKKTASDFSPQGFNPKNFGAAVSSSVSSNIAAVEAIEAPTVSVFEQPQSAAPQRSASLTADQQFWTPRR